MKVVIVGAGIGGLTLGVALRRRGHEVHIVEKRSEFSDEGAGVVLGPNVLAAARLLDLDGLIQAAGRAVQALNITDQYGRSLARSRYSVAELPLPGVAIHRSRLHELLRDRFDGLLELGAELRAWSFGERPSVMLSSGQVPCDLVVGADGIRSQLRQALAPELEIRYSGTTCFRYVVDEQWTEEVFEQWGPGKRVGVVPLGHGQTYVFLTLNRSRRAPKPFATLSEFRALWSEFRGPAARALEALDDLERVLHNDLEDVLAPRFWAPGVALLGDAAHAVTPNMGQGAGLAIEDACCLASLLPAHATSGRPELGGSRDSKFKPEVEAGSGSLTESELELEPKRASLADALAKYEQLRRPRAEWILRRSYSLGKVAQVEWAPLRWLRDWALRLTPASVNDGTLRRIVCEMPGVPVEHQLADGRA
jgi:2-heptyl-3-hydroxy-4(1H)-quinolone synthase